ncbi:ADP-ribosylation/crystallin J1 [Bacteroides sp. 519]|uniref:ADP-ribosylation/crystallin J1 n=1 Tax=Bacteroides sp. 519 TaxID=2302937 RepID=UPI0013D6AC81|nr:ADP-ribosylation/crystallin J1 [Bacteroides sp. 519]NDV60383.1 ADP-ribosylation/crystallin J1 [Bacteroides sp. 519]
MKTTLYRPVGLKELQLIIDLNFKGFPPRLEWQPIFYPVLNQEYAEQIAEKWNINDEFSGYCGIVTAFQMPTEYLKKYEVHNVGGFIHNELWVPAEELEEFNANMIGNIEVKKVFFGNKFDAAQEDVATKFITTQRF